MKISILGSGSFGSTMAIVLANNLIAGEKGTEVKMYIRRSDLFEELVKTRIHPDYEVLADIPFPKNISFDLSLEDTVKEATHLIFAVPSKYAIQTLQKIKGLISQECKVISLVKGFFIDNQYNFMRISSLISNTLEIPYENICSLSGPNLYSEIACNYSIGSRIHRSCNVVFSSTSNKTAQEFQRLYYTKDIIRTYYSDDIISSEICGALKNVIAIMSGIGDGYKEGLGMGNNFKASLITRALFEFSYFTRALGGNPISVYGLAGLGDLIATSLNGRSYKAGLKIASGLSVDEVKAAMAPTEIEGFQTLTVIDKFLKSLRINNPNLHFHLPLIEIAYKLVFEKYDLDDAVNDIINRPLKKEIREDPYIKLSS